MGVLVIDWQTYYDAGKKCHALATDLRAADKPVHDAVKGECAGMAGNTAGCEQWGITYDRVARETMQTCTNLADALTNFGNMLYAAGYNWALSNNSNPMPDRPTVTAMSEYKVTIPTSVGNNGDGVTEGSGSVPGFYDALVGKVQEEFGSKLPNGNKDKLAKAASTWKTFAEHKTITDAASRITEISNLFSDIQDKKGLDPILGHLTTLNGGATQLASASLNLATPVAEYSTATSETRDKFRDAVTNALIAAGTTVVIGVAASWITAALSDVAAGVGVVAIAGNTARVLKSTYDASKLIKIIGTASAVAGVAAFTVTAFDKVPSLTDIALKLAAIIAMKVYIDDEDKFENLPLAPGNPAPGMTDEVEKYILGKHVKGAPNYNPSKGTWPDTITGEELDELAEAAENSPARGPNHDGNFEREVDAGKVIGSVSEQLGGHATSRYKIITDRFGGIITMYPIP
ncbi:hypothetical protein AB0L97_35315 [Nocardia sp. NPDC051911]|uniref:hypothetical protein n=1 Tax=Nocardia sp. NPDC051911 TaxID=3154648 RepID=UPI003416C6E7